MATFSHENEPSNADPRRCPQKPAPTLSTAKRYYLFLVGLCWLFRAAQPLDKLWTSFPAHQTNLGLQAFAVGCWGLLVLVSTIILCASMQKPLQLAKEIERDGMTVRGEVIDKWTWGGDVTAYCVGYRFTYLGTTWVGRDTIRASLFKRLKIGNSIAIRFLPRDLRISRVEQDEIQ